MFEIKDDEISILIRWEINELEDKVKLLREELDTLMIHRNTAALREIVLQEAGLPYPSDLDDVITLDHQVENKVQEIKYTRKQIAAWKVLHKDLINPQTRTRIEPSIRTVEL